MAVGLYLLLENFTDILGQSSAADEWHGLPELLRDTAIVIVQATSGWLVCLLVVGHARGSGGGVPSMATVG